MHLEVAVTHSLMIVGRKTGIELKATLQLKNMNYRQIRAISDRRMKHIRLTAAIYALGSAAVLAISLQSKRFTGAC
jgi:cbb3-type cytochrome oxidase subunit 1